MRSPSFRDERGVALLFVLFLLLAIGAMAMSAVAVVGNTALIGARDEQQSNLEILAEAGLEVGRARLNGDTALYPKSGSGYATLESGVSVLDAYGRAIPGVKRYTYAGPIGNATGEYGVNGTIISITRAANGERVVRRREITQESFARFAYFTEVEGNIVFGSGDVIQGPVHSNDDLTIYRTGASFLGPGKVTTAGRISGRQYGTFRGGWQERVSSIPLPPTTDLARLRGLAASGSAAFDEPSGGASGATRLRIEFLTIDLNNNGRVEESEGFFRVYRSNNAAWLMSRTAGSSWPASDNCGVHQGAPYTPQNFVLIGDLKRGNGNPTNTVEKLAALRLASSRCYLGGSEALSGGTFDAVDGRGSWLPRGWGVPAALADNPRFSSRDDRDYLFPLERSFNPSFKGVIHVNGNVGVSGEVNGRITLAATGNIFILDDLTYAIDPGGGTCQNMLGLYSARDVIIADNNLNQPQSIGTGWVTFDNTADEYIHGVILALSNFYAENFDGDKGSHTTDAERCGSDRRERGCLYLTGGIIQKERGGVGTTNGYGYKKRYAYDVCAFTRTPPYFPTTGRFDSNQLREVDPTRFDVAHFFAEMQKSH